MNKLWVKTRLKKSLLTRNRKPDSLKSPRSFPVIPVCEEIDEENIDLVFELPERPLVSIVIPVFNKIEYTYSCIRSVKSNTADISYELIVIDDCSTDRTRGVLSKIPGIKYVRNHSNSGFIKSCNRAVEHCAGKFVCFLNNDTQVQPGWLKALVDTFEGDPQVGAVGSRLVYADGYLQEAGGVIWDDGSGANYGNGYDPFLPEYSYVRQVDYCSGASLMLSRDDFLRLGGFDQRYLPAYYEDADICFQVRHTLSKRVVYQPESVVVHFEGITSGKDLSAGVKKYQLVNQEKFYDKWKKELSSEYLSRKNGQYAGASRLSRRKILVVDYQVPQYDRDSGSQRLFHIIRCLKNLGHHVIFFPHKYQKSESRYIAALQNIGVEVLYQLYEDNSPIDQLFERLKYIDIAWVCRPRMMEKYCDFLRMNKNIRVIYDTIDLHYLRIRKEEELGIGKKGQWKSYKKLEIKMARRADSVIAITSEEASSLKSFTKSNVYIVPNIHVPNSSTGKSYLDRGGLLFIGGYQHTPNLDAAKWLLTEIMPEVWKRLSDLQITLIGSNPPEELLEYSSDHVVFPGYVEDVSGYFNGNRVFVCPLRYGAGMKGKIGQSLEFGLPIVSTSYGVQGMGMVDGEHFILANTRDEFVQAILTLYGSEPTWSKLQAGAVKVLQPFSPERIQEDLEAIVSYS